MTHLHFFLLCSELETDRVLRFILDALALIQIAQDGTVTVAGEKCAPAQLAAKLSGLGAKQAIVHVDPGAADTQVTAVMDACKAAGVEQVHGILNPK